MTRQQLYSSAVLCLGLATVVTGCTTHSCIDNTTQLEKIHSLVPSDILDARGLEELLLRFVEAQCSCEFPEEISSRVADGIYSNSATNPSELLDCIGPAKIKKIVRSDANQLGIEVTTLGNSEDYLIVAVHSGSEWLVYWPERLPGGFHPQR